MFIIPEIEQLNGENLVKASKVLQQAELHPISCVNWPETFPYRPQVGFRIAHNNEELFLRFTVLEDCTMALTKRDHGRVWTDSCVEFFIALDKNGYYNFEFSCIGKALLGYRQDRTNAVHAPAEIMKTIKRYSTLGTENFEEKQVGLWELTVAIPYTALFQHHLTKWSGVSAWVNVYKCGDNLSKPHYLSWQPIDTKRPDFHVPQFFKKVKFY